MARRLASFSGRSVPDAETLTSGWKVDEILAQVNVAELQRSLELAWKENATLKDENFRLKKAVKAFLAFNIKIPEDISLEVPEERPLSWAEKSERFKPLLKAIVETVVQLTKEDGQAHHYDVIEARISARYPTLYKSLTQASGTIAARARDLRRDGYLQTPQGEQATFLPGPKVLRGELP
jgi:hypothetical protein